jgi:hypothetical protein
MVKYNPLREIMIQQLRARGRQTRLQLFHAGMSWKQIEHLVECDILVSELDPATNLYYLSVPDDLSP